MGMAASQARFLQLTARRTNIEYMGQQINQQRLALANASAGLFEKMLTLVPPTPPSSQDDKYYTQGYNFTDPTDELQKNISWDTMTNGEAVLAFPADTARTGPVTNSSIRITNTAGVTTDLTQAQLVAAATTGTDAEVAVVANAVGADTSKNSEGYTQVVRYVAIEHNVYDPDGNYKPIVENAPALLEFDNLNRLIRTTLLDGATLDMRETATANKANVIDGGDKLTYSSKFDEKSYSDDMNKYEFQKASYDYQIERINQETRQIQSQDKSLELKMKQLDTEHNAVQTEMDAVQKVIQKNIEGSFKTFA